MASERLFLQASDAVFFTAEHRGQPTLHLALAHRGNIMEDGAKAESILLRLDPDAGDFTIEQG